MSWTFYNSSGQRLQTFGFVAATQAEMEAGSSTTAYVTPGRAQYHPGVAKGHLQWLGNGTIQSNSYNVTSLARTGTGQYTITWATHFGSGDYQCVGSCQGGTDSMCVFSTPAAGTQLVEIYVNGTGTDSITNVAAFGDQ